MTRNSLERRKVFLGRLASLSAIAFVVALALLSAACNNVNLAGEGKGSGTVSLAIGDVLTKSVRSAGEPLRQTLAAGTEYIVKARLSGGHTAETSITVDSGKLAEAALSFEGIPIGVTVRLDLEVRAGNNLVWIGSTVDDHTVVSGENPLSVEVVRVSGVLLWKPQQEGAQSHDVYIAPYGNYNSSLLTQFGIYTEQDTRRPYCFDSNGNLYGVVSATSPQIKKYNSQLDGTYVEDSELDDFVSNPSDVSYLAYDNDSGKLYGLGANTPLYNLSDDVNITNNTNFPQPLGLAIHNDIAYVAEVIEGNESGGIYVTLHQYNLTSTAGGTSQKTEAIRLPPVFGTDVSALTGHMIYQDGALYLSIGCLDIVFDASGAGIAGYSIGAVVKINAATLVIEESFGKDGYLGLLTSSREINGEKCYTPTEANENDYFYGPMGFVAVMPKKLVIADSGLEMSKADDGTNVKLSKKSRIVTIDLETEAFESVSMDGYYVINVSSFTE